VSFELVKAVERERAGVHSTWIDVAMEDVVRLCRCVAQSRPHYRAEYLSPDGGISKQTGEMN
jgi:hypothetical protein